jgi:biopolymer transport protein ExbD
MPVPSAFQTMNLAAWTPSKALAARVAKRKPNYFIYLNLWPFVTVMIALLFLFMPLTVVDVSGIAIDRPPARNASPQAHARREDSMHLVITRDGKFFFSSSGDTNFTRIEIQELTPLLRDAEKNAVEKKLYLDADARCRYIDVELAVEQFRAAGITNIVIMTENPPHVSTTSP